jgi:predicted helicase
MRKHLLEDFTRIYHVDLHGNVRVNTKLSGTTHNVFGIQLGVGITIAVRSSQHQARQVFYYRVPEFWRKTEKLTFLKEKGSLSKIDWQELRPDRNYTWLTEGLQNEFTTFLLMGKKVAKTVLNEVACIFKLYSIGVLTSRDNWVYDFSRNS